VKRLWIAIFGGTVLLLGIAMIVLPGPAMVLIPAGLAVLGTEFLWARHALRRAKRVAVKVRRESGLRAWLRRRRKQKPEGASALGFGA